MAARKVLAQVSLVLAAIAWSSRVAGAQGTVLHAIVADANTNDYLPDASVTVDPLGLKAATDFSGDTRFAGLRKGHYIVHARKLGYAPIETDVDITGRDSVEITFTLRPITHELAAVKVEETLTSPFLREFEERRKLGTGQYIVDSVLRASFPSSLDVILSSRIRGLRASRNLDGSIALSSSRGSNSLRGGCPISVYWNGVRITSKHLGPIVDISESLIGGIEFYNPGQTPVQYQEPGNDCGVLLLWPRP